MDDDKRALTTKLSGYDTFAKCSKSDIEALVEAGSPFALPAGWPLVQEGIPADACYVITEGAAFVFHQRDKIAELAVGDLVGEMSLLEGGQRRATVTTSDRTRGLRIDNEKLAPLLRDHPALAEAFRTVYEAHSGS